VKCKSALSYGDAEVLGATVKRKLRGFGYILELVRADKFRTRQQAILFLIQYRSTDNGYSAGKKWLSLSCQAQRVFEYLLNHAPDRVEETDEYTRVRVGDLYDLIVGESEGVLVSSLTVSVRGELIKVRGEDLVLAQGISSEDIDFWAVVAEQLDGIEARSRDYELEEPDSQSGLGG
jgi:hypothetical protein